MTEVEIRGPLTEEKYEELKDFLSKNGEVVKSYEREMYLLRGYPGYDLNPMAREADIRLRRTNDDCEIMLKRKKLDGNRGREEVSLKLADNNLGNAKKILKALGFEGGLKMHRFAEVFNYKNIEWSLERSDKGHLYYEAEKEVPDENLESAHDELVKEAEALGLKVFDSEEMRAFIKMLDREANVEAEF